MEGKYSSEEINIQTSTSLSEIDIDVLMGTLDTESGLGNTRYRIVPLVYWREDGAFVLDYVVKPETSDAVPIFWNRNYGAAPDLAFSLSWRYDEEKNIGLDEPAQRYLTRDISFTPANPREGEIVTIRALIHNYSLKDADAPVKVKFYLEDPDNGGTLMTGTNGETEIEVGSLAARGTTAIEMDWLVPDIMSTTPRIYAVIDAENTTDEIHENNNKGWNVLRKIDTITAVDSPAEAVITTFELQQNYPNPFNPSTSIQYSVGSNQLVSLKIFNIMGREVATLINQQQTAGIYRVSFNGAGLPSGVYFYRLDVGSAFRETRKMLLTK